MRTFIETKERLRDGAILTFECEPVAYEPNRAICLFRSTGSFATTTFTMRKGGLSYGFFWRHRPYILYRISEPDGSLIGHRFDVVDRVRIKPDGATYRDLVVDAWVPAGGDLRLEDEDELAELVEQGKVAPSLAADITRVARGLERDHTRIRSEVEDALRPYLPG